MNPTEVGMEPETSEDDVIPPQIEELLRDRSTLVEWLERLRERRDDVRPAVYQKVRDDYRERLDEVEVHLSEHRSDLERALGERREAVGQLEEERDERAAELEEAELRHEVGELEEEEWEEASGGLRESLDELDESLEEEGAAVRRLEEVLEELAGLEDASDAGVGGGVAGGPDRDQTAARPDRGRTGEAPAAEAGPVDGSRTADVDAPGAAKTGEASAEVEEAPAIEGGDGWPAPDLGVAEEDERGPSGSAEDDGATDGAGTGADEDAAPEPEPEPRPAGGRAGDEDADFDELDFLESLSLDEPDSLDTLGMELDDDEEAASDGEETGEEDRGGPGG